MAISDFRVIDASRLARVFSSGRAAVALCFGLFFAVCISLANVLELSSWFVLLALAAAAVAVVRRVSGQRAADGSISGLLPPC